MQILSTCGMITSPWCQLGVFQSQLKTKLLTAADCFSVRLCYRPGSSKSETQKWDYLRVCLCVVHSTAYGFKAWHSPIWTLASLHTGQLSLLCKCLYYHVPRHQCFSAWAVQGLVDLIWPQSCVGWKLPCVHMCSRVMHSVASVCMYRSLSNFRGQNIFCKSPYVRKLNAWNSFFTATA